MIGKKSTRKCKKCKRSFKRHERGNGEARICDDCFQISVSKRAVKMKILYGVDRSKKMSIPFSSL